MDVRSILHNPIRLPADRLLRCLLLALALVFVGRPAGGQETSPQWWNPTTWASGDKTVRKSSYFSGDNAKSGESKSWFSLPKGPWSASDKPKVDGPSGTSSTPSMFSKVGKSTKRAWNDTVDFLNPFDNQPASPQQQGYQPQDMTTKKGTGMFGWMWQEETPETPTSVNEFLRQERPRF